MSDNGFRPWSILRFSKHVAENLRSNHEFAFFLGAGCSVTSGIDDARKLTCRWIEEMWRHDPDGCATWQAFAIKHFPDLTEQRAAAFHPQVIQARHLSEEEQHQEIMRVYAHDPASGQAALPEVVRLIADEAPAESLDTFSIWQECRQASAIAS